MLMVNKWDGKENSKKNTSLGILPPRASHFGVGQPVSVMGLLVDQGSRHRPRDTFAKNAVCRECWRIRTGPALGVFSLKKGDFSVSWRCPSLAESEVAPGLMLEFH